MLLLLAKKRWAAGTKVKKSQEVPREGGVTSTFFSVHFVFACNFLQFSKRRKTMSE